MPFNQNHNMSSSLSTYSTEFSLIVSISGIKYAPSIKTHDDLEVLKSAYILKLFVSVKPTCQ